MYKTDTHSNNTRLSSSSSSSSSTLSNISERRPVSSCINNSRVPSVPNLPRLSTITSASSSLITRCDRRTQPAATCSSRSTPLPPSISEIDASKRPQSAGDESTNQKKDEKDAELGALWRELLELVWDIVKLKTRRRLQQLHRTSRTQLLRTRQSLKSVMLRAFERLSQTQERAATERSAATAATPSSMPNPSPSSSSHSLCSGSSSNNSINAAQTRHSSRCAVCQQVSADCWPQQSWLTAAAAADNYDTFGGEQCRTCLTTLAAQPQQWLQPLRKSSLTKPRRLHCENLSAVPALDILIRPKKSLSFAAQASVIRHNNIPPSSVSGCDADGDNNNRVNAADGVESIYLTPTSSRTTITTSRAVNKTITTPVKPLRKRIPATIFDDESEQQPMTDLAQHRSSSESSAAAPIPPPRSSRCSQQRGHKPWIKTLPRFSAAAADADFSLALIKERDAAAQKNMKAVVDHSNAACDSGIEVTLKARPSYYSSRTDGVHNKTTTAIPSTSLSRHAGESRLGVLQQDLSREEKQLQEENDDLLSPEVKLVKRHRPPAPRPPGTASRSNNIYGLTLTAGGDSSSSIARRANSNNKHSSSFSSATVRVPNIGDTSVEQQSSAAGSLTSLTCNRYAAADDADSVTTAKQQDKFSKNCRLAYATVTSTTATTIVATEEAAVIDDSFVNRAETLLTKIDALLKSEHDDDDVDVDDNVIDFSRSPASKRMPNSTTAIMSTDIVKKSVFPDNDDADNIYADNLTEQDEHHQQLLMNATAAAVAISSSSCTRTPLKRFTTTTSPVKSRNNSCSVTGEPILLRKPPNFRHHLENLKVSI